MRSDEMVGSRARCWDEDALSAVSIALYLYLGLAAMQSWAHVDQASRAVSQLLHPIKALHTMASPCS